MINAANMTNQKASRSSDNRNSHNRNKSVLIIGYGNPGRQDDGLGPACARIIKSLKLEYVSVDISYQLVVEHAYDIAKADIVIFIDAFRSGELPFFFNALASESESTAFGSHTLTPTDVKTLAKTVYSASPQCYILGIRGYLFDQFEERLSADAESNLRLAAKFLIDWFNTQYQQQT